MLVVTEFALWDSVMFTWGKQLIFWVKDKCIIRADLLCLSDKGVLRDLLFGDRSFCCLKGVLSLKICIVFCSLVQTGILLNLSGIFIKVWLTFHSCTPHFITVTALYPLWWKRTCQLHISTLFLFALKDYTKWSTGWPALANPVMWSVCCYSWNECQTLHTCRALPILATLT